MSAQTETAKNIKADSARPKTPRFALFDAFPTTPMSAQSSLIKCAGGLLWKSERD
jgi:hypothetical protein